MGESGVNFDKEFRARRLEASAAIHIYNVEYRNALRVLSRLKELQSNANVASKIHSMVMEGTCHLFLCEYSAASEVIQKMFEMLKSSCLSPDDIFTKAEIFKDEQRWARAYILYYVACKLCISKLVQDAASKIKSVFFELKKMTTEMVKSSSDQAVASKHMVPAMAKMMEELITVPDNGNHEMIKDEAWCYFNIAWCYDLLNDNCQNLKMNEAGIKLMKDKLGGDAEKYYITGHCYHNAGLANKALGYKNDARESYNSAIRVYEKAVDLADYKEREKEIEGTRRALNNLWK